jgi:hypothetical protein
MFHSTLGVGVQEGELTEACEEFTTAPSVLGPEGQLEEEGMQWWGRGGEGRGGASLNQSAKM